MRKFWLTMVAVFSLCPGVHSQEFDPGTNEENIAKVYLGLLVDRPTYDLQPAGTFENGTFHLISFGNGSGDPGDLPPFDLDFDPGDRIFYSSTNGLNGWRTSWTEYQKIVWKGRGGITGQPETDDHLVGSPTGTLVINGKKYVFIETYVWTTRVARYKNIHNGEMWTDNGITDFNGFKPDDDGTYIEDPAKATATSNLGFAPRYRRAGTHPVYSGEVIYPNGIKNRFLALSPIVDRTDGEGTWRSLNNGKAVFFLYDSAGPGRKQLSQFWDSANWDTFVTDEADGEIAGAVPAGVLGFAATTLEGNDLFGTLQNHIRLLVADNWTDFEAFDGAAQDGAVLSPVVPHTAQWPHDSPLPEERFDPARRYGAGYPMALERNGFLELFYHDDSQSDSVGIWIVRIPIGDIENASAYINAPRMHLAGVPTFHDIKWSPKYERYFAVAYSPVSYPPDPNNQKPVLIWSEKNPPSNRPPNFGFNQTPSRDFIEVNLPAGQGAAWGGLIGDTLGHTIDEFAGYTPFHIVFEQYPTGIPGTGSPHTRSIGHALIFHWDQNKLKRKRKDSE